MKTTTANFTNRQTFVGLNGNFGTVSLGRQYNAASMFYSKNTSNDVTGRDAGQLAAKPKRFADP